MSDHAFLLPSAAHAWVLCPMWPTMNALYAETEPSPAAVEGAQAHAAALAVRGGAPYPPDMDDGLAEAVEVYVGELQGKPGLHLEEPVRGKTVHPSLNWGTPDAWSYEGGVLRVWDFKTGFSYVPHYMNWQGINYVSLLLDTLGVDGRTDQHIQVEITIVQPRYYGREGPVRTWKVGPASNLRAQINILKAAAEDATQPTPAAKPHPTACENCPGRHACPAIQNEAAAAADRSVAAALPVDLPLPAASREWRSLLRARDLLDARLSGLAQQLTSALKAGTAVRGAALESSQGRESWTVPVEQVVTLGELSGVPLTKPAVMTPKQARDKGMPAEVVALYASRKAGEAKLVPMDDSRARQLFGG